jgi:hypothetical protein
VRRGRSTGVPSHERRPQVDGTAERRFVIEVGREMPRFVVGRSHQHQAVAAAGRGAHRASELVGALDPVAAGQQVAQHRHLVDIHPSTVP